MPTTFGAMLSIGCIVGCAGGIMREPTRGSGRDRTEPSEGVGPFEDGTRETSAILFPEPRECTAGAAPPVVEMPIDEIVR